MHVDMPGEGCPVCGIRMKRGLDECPNCGTRMSPVREIRAARRRREKRYEQGGSWVFDRSKYD